MSGLLCLLVFAGTAAAGEEYGVRTLAVNGVLLKADEIAFDITASTSLTVSREQVASALGSVGVTAQDLTSVSVWRERGTVTQNIGFQLVVPFGQLVETARKLDALNAKLPDQITELSYEFTARSTKTQADEAINRMLVTLSAEARRSAEKIAQAAGVSIGELRALGTDKRLLSLRNLAYVETTYAIGGSDGQGGAVLEVPLESEPELVPDTAVFEITVMAPIGFTLADASTALAGLGAETELVSISGGLIPEMPGVGLPAGVIQYVFSVDTPAENGANVSAKLEELIRQTRSVQIDYYMDMSPGETAYQAAVDGAWPELISEARRRGEVLAAASGKRLGAIKSINASFTPMVVFALE